MTSAINKGTPQVDLAALDWPEGARFAFSDELGEHDPCYVVMPGGASLPVNHHDRQGVDIARARFIVDAGNAALDQAQHDRDDDETYEIGKRDGREEAVQEIDRLTGGDGEYFYSTLPGRGCPGPADMIKNIADRFVTLRARAEKAEAEVARLEAALTDTRACLLAGGMTARLEAIGGIDAALAASRPDPAGQSSAQPAVERDVCKICDGTNFVHGADGLTVCPVCVGAAPPAAGSAAGKRK